MVFYWSLSDSKSPQVSRTLLSILSNRKNVVDWMVSTRPFIFSSSTNLSMTVPSTPIRISFTVTFIFHSFFSSLPCPAGWGCRMLWLHLCRGVNLSPNEYLWYDAKPSDDEVPGMWSTSSLPSLPGLLWPRSGSTW